MTEAEIPLRVLVIDDDVECAEALSALLALMGCSTAVAFDGAHGLDAVAEFDPHLALIDLEMPDMSGCDLARLLRSMTSRDSTRLACLTGRGQPEDRRTCMDAGFDDFFTKPIQPAQLSDLVEAAKEEQMR